MDEGALVAWQLGRAPRGVWRTQARCSFGYPTTIATSPVTESGQPFPTLYYLTCPHLVEVVSRLESAGAIEEWRRTVAFDEGLAARLMCADAAYRGARAIEGEGVDPTPGAGIAGQRDPLAIKCLHAHVAAFLAGIDDPVGKEVVAGVVAECANERCGGMA